MKIPGDPRCLLFVELLISYTTLIKSDSLEAFSSSGRVFHICSLVLWVDRLLGCEVEGIITAEVKKGRWIHWSCFSTIHFIEVVWPLTGTYNRVYSIDRGDARKSWYPPLFFHLVMRKEKTHTYISLIMAPAMVNTAYLAYFPWIFTRILEEIWKLTWPS